MRDDEELPVWSIAIQRLTEQSGLSQAEIARRAGLTKDAFNRYHSGRTRPPRLKLESMAGVFGVHPNDIDPDRLTLVKDPRRKIQPYSVGRSATGDHSRVHFRLEMDMSASGMARMIEIANEELEKNEAKSGDE